MKSDRPVQCKSGMFALDPTENSPVGKSNTQPDARQREREKPMFEASAGDPLTGITQEGLGIHERTPPQVNLRTNRS
jgi:hypothetical protein